MKIAHKKTEKNGQKSGKKIPVPDSRINALLSDESGKLPIAECKETLCKFGAAYTDEEVAIIRKTLYALADVDYNYHIQLSKPARSTPEISIPLTPENTTSPNNTPQHEQQKSYPLHPSVYRRAS